MLFTTTSIQRKSILFFFSTNIYILSKKYRELIILKARLKRLSKTFLTLSWYHCLLSTDVEFERDLSFSLFTVLNVVSLSQVHFTIFPMDKNIKQRICLKFCIANVISCAESLIILQKAYGELTLSKTLAYEWYGAFKSGWYMVEDLPCSGRPSTSSTEVNIAKVKEMVTENCHSSLKEIAAELINNCLGMKRVAPRLVLKNPNFLQKLNHAKAKNSTNIIEQPPYSPDGSSRLFSLSKTQITTSRHRFSVDERHKRKFAARTEVDYGKCV